MSEDEPVEVAARGSRDMDAQLGQLRRRVLQAMHEGSLHQPGAYTDLSRSFPGILPAAKAMPRGARDQEPSSSAPRERSPHGRARRRERSPHGRGGFCNCTCINSPQGRLGPRPPEGQRCSCPMCGHRSIHQGSGCYFYVATHPFSTRNAVLCVHCQQFCLGVLRWADRFYERFWSHS